MWALLWDLASLIVKTINYCVLHIFDSVRWAKNVKSVPKVPNTFLSQRSASWFQPKPIDSFQFKKCWRGSRWATSKACQVCRQDQQRVQWKLDFATHVLFCLFFWLFHWESYDKSCRKRAERTTGSRCESFSHLKVTVLKVLNDLYKGDIFEEDANSAGLNLKQLRVAPFTVQMCSENSKSWTSFPGFMVATLNFESDWQTAGQWDRRNWLKKRLKLLTKFGYQKRLVLSVFVAGIILGKSIADSLRIGKCNVISDSHILRMWIWRFFTARNWISPNRVQFTSRKNFLGLGLLTVKFWTEFSVYHASLLFLTKPQRNLNHNPENCNVGWSKEMNHGSNREIIPFSARKEFSTCFLVPSWMRRAILSLRTVKEKSVRRNLGYTKESESSCPFESYKVFA